MITSCGGGGDAREPDAAPADAEALDAAAMDAPDVMNSTLAALTTSVGGLAPPFEPEIVVYDLDLLLAEDQLAFVPIAAVAAGTTITVDGVAVSSGALSTMLALPPGSVDVEIVVTASDATATTYTIHVHRGVDALASLVPSIGVLTPTFAPATTSYTATLPIAAASMTWTPTLMVPSRSSVTVGGIPVGSGAASSQLALAAGGNDVAITVSPLTRPPQVYIADIFRGTDALASIELSYAEGAVPGRLTPTFIPETAAYAVSVGLWLQRVQITATPLLAGSTITINGSPATAGQPTASIALGLGTTSIPIVVTAAGGEQSTYTLQVTREAQALQEAYVKASSNAPNAYFGFSIAMWGDTLVVGGGGAVHVFTRTGTSWTQQARLVAGAGNSFGSSVAIWGDTLAVGAKSDSSSSVGVGGNQADTSAPGAGAVYVFTRNEATWSQQAYIKASNTAPGANFGDQVALWRDTLAVATNLEDGGSTGINGNQFDQTGGNSGAAYVFTRTGVSWAQQAYIKASNPDQNDSFGYSIALWGDTLAVGAYAEDSAATGIGGNQASNTAYQSGAAYVFVRAGSAWSQQAYVKASNTAADGGNLGDHFGYSIALSGDTLAVGALDEDSAAVGVGGSQSSTSAGNSGAVYVFTRAGTTWSQQAYVKASNTASDDQFGVAVAIWGDTLAVGASGEDSVAVGIGGSQASNAAADSGAAYVFTRSGSTWTQQSYVKASNTGAFDDFGFPLAVWADTVVASAWNEDSAATGVGGNQVDNTVSAAGAVYVFR